MVAGDAVERRTRATRSVLHAMTVDAPTNGQRRRSRAQTDEAQQVVAEVLSSPSADDPHALDGPVAGLAGEAPA